MACRGDKVHPFRPLLNLYIKYAFYKMLKFLLFDLTLPIVIIVTSSHVLGIHLTVWHKTNTSKGMVKWQVILLFFFKRLHTGCNRKGYLTKFYFMLPLM